MGATGKRYKGPVKNEFTFKTKCQSRCLNDKNDLFKFYSLFLSSFGLKISTTALVCQK